MNKENEMAKMLLYDVKRELRKVNVLANGFSYHQLSYEELEDIFEKNKVLTMYIQARDWFEFHALINNGFTHLEVTKCLNKFNIQFREDKINENHLTILYDKYNQCYVNRSKEDIANRFKTDIDAVKPLIRQVFENVQSSSLDYFWFNQARNAFNQSFLFAMKSTYEDPDPI